MDERDLEPEQALSRLGIDELGAGASERVERGVDVLDLECHVMHSCAARGEEPADGSVAVEWRKQLESPFADEHRRGLHALVGHRRAVLELGAEQSRVRVERLVEIRDRDAYVMNAACVHARRCYPPPAGGPPDEGSG